MLGLPIFLFVMYLMFPAGDPTSAARYNSIFDAGPWLSLFTAFSGQAVPCISRTGLIRFSPPVGWAAVSTPVLPLSRQIGMMYLFLSSL